VRHASHQSARTLVHLHNAQHAGLSCPCAPCHLPRVTRYARLCAPMRSAEQQDTSRAAILGLRHACPSASLTARPASHVRKLGGPRGGRRKRRASSLAGVRERSHAGVRPHPPASGTTCRWATSSREQQVRLPAGSLSPLLLRSAGR
jgi:hypothetical protein